MFKLSQFIHGDSSLAQLTQQSQSILNTQKAWQNVAPSALLALTQAGAVQHKRLTLYCFNGAVAAKIKLMLPTLLVQLQKQGLEVTSIRVVVQVKSFVTSIKKPHRIIGKQGSLALKSLAENLPDSALGESLKRLSSRTQ